VKLSYLFFGNQPDIKWTLARQMGIKYAIAKLAPELTGDLPPWDLKSLERSKKVFASQGLDLIGLEGDQFDMSAIKLGTSERQLMIERYQQMLINMGKLDIRLLCYNFMAGIGWYRNAIAIRERGGALVSGFKAWEEPAHDLPVITSDRIWENYKGFIDQVIPYAEKAGVKMALHPDDPPVPMLKGFGRLFINAQAVRKALQLSDSPSHGITFCQGTYQTMGEDVTKLIKEFGAAGRIFFVHVRDIVGTATDFRETFHDNGSIDWIEAFRCYKELDASVPLRSDHIPTMGNDSNEHGYSIKGNLFGVGYIKGIMKALDIEND
jgi:mannonate dehydratase